ncbi:hypothetical protein [Chromobacterium violaceum]|uniref:hypothetical protein n=1 Tax=Chromobacterium violaceum TaxID=536 RepID=UPI000AD2C40F|nr:hypothetical protein [Chromobacterium violaceum]
MAERFSPGREQNRDRSARLTVQYRLASGFQPSGHRGPTLSLASWAGIAPIPQVTELKLKRLAAAVAPTAARSHFITV